MLVFDIDDRQGKSRHLRRIGDEDGIKGAVLDGIVERHMECPAPVHRGFSSFIPFISDPPLFSLLFLLTFLLKFLSS